MPMRQGDSVHVAAVLSSPHLSACVYFGHGRTALCRSLRPRAAVVGGGSKYRQQIPLRLILMHQSSRHSHACRPSPRSCIGRWSNRGVWLWCADRGRLRPGDGGRHRRRRAPRALHHRRRGHRAAADARRRGPAIKASRPRAVRVRRRPRRSRSVEERTIAAGCRGPNHAHGRVLFGRGAGLVSERCQGASPVLAVRLPPFLLWNCRFAGFVWDVSS